MEKKTYTFIDCEYVYTCARSDGKIPNYKGIIDLLRYHHRKNNIMTSYFMGPKKRKESVSNFLIKSGMDFVSIIEREYCSKLQIIGSTLAIDVVKLVINEDVEQFIFLTGNDYLVPTIEFLNEYDFRPIVYYFPLILSDQLKTSECELFRLREGCFIYPRKPDEHTRIHTASSTDQQE